MPSSSCVTMRATIAMTASFTSVGERAEELHLGGALGQPFLLATLAVGGEIGRLAVDVEGRVVLVLLVEDEDVGILRGAVRAIDEAARLGLAHHRGLLREQRRQRVALALRRPDLRHYRKHVSHGWKSPFCPSGSTAAIISRASVPRNRLTCARRPSHPEA